MSDRERVRRPEPVRTDPVRHASGVVRDEDPVGRAVRAGCEVVEQAVRRGFGLGRVPFPEPPWGGAGSGDPVRPVGPWSTGQWVDAMTGAFAMWAQWADGWSAAARSVMAGGTPRDAGSGAWPASPWTSPPGAAASPSAGAAGPLQVVVEIRAARAACVQLDLFPGLLPGGAGAALEIHGLLAPAAAAAPPITEVTVAVVAGQVTVAIGGIDHHPAAIYAGAVLAAGRAAGTLTVRLI